MTDFAIITDSSCDLPAKMAMELELTVVSLTFSIQGKDFRNCLDENEISYKEVYSLLRSGEMAKTSAVNIGAFIDAMEPILAAGQDILYLAFSSGLSNTYNAGVLAAEEMKKISRPGNLYR